MSIIRAKKRLGQHFLTDPNIVRHMISSARISRDETVVEIGPGRGVLTFDIARHAGDVIAIEKDRDLIAPLTHRARIEGLSNIAFMNADIRDVTLSSVVVRPYVVVANIPYYLTAYLFRKFLQEESKKPLRMICMVQREVADRIVSRGRQSLLSVSIQAYGSAKKLFSVPRSAFFPSPDVDSAVIEVSRISPKRFEDASVSEETFFRVVRTGFSHPRKLLVSNIADGIGISKEKIMRAFEHLRIQKKARAGELSLEQWFSVARMMRDTS